MVMKSIHLPPLVLPNGFAGNKKPQPAVVPMKSLLLLLLLLFSLLSYGFFLAPRLHFYSLLRRKDHSLMPHSTLCCDRTAFHTDLCFMRGDIRTHSPSNSILLHSHAAPLLPEERIRPYTRKWEPDVMATVHELRLRVADSRDDDRAAACHVAHDVPAVVFSTGGYTGNVYHEFNDGIVPLYLTSRRFRKRVVFVLLDYHNWWVSKYGDILSRLSDRQVVNFSNDSRTHCFPEAIVGLRFHGDLTVDAGRMDNGETIQDFRRMLDEAYRPRIRSLERAEERTSPQPMEAAFDKRLKLVIILRTGSRVIENEREVVRLAEEVGFNVEVVKPERTTELAKIYRSLNSSDAMVGVHGAAMTHFLFMRPGSAFIQIVPLGTDWAAEEFYGAPAAKMGLWYVGYRVASKESSLHREYGENDTVLRDPTSVNAKGWQATKRVYLDRQNVSLDLSRFRPYLVRAHKHLMGSRALN